ncbi:16S rRNA (adenine(1518)-N(6)/adenine(1519)-N(6))-dimethyltransferase RsmA [Thauera aminoaromatica]|uniref:Ribosomal RNA small subunit methyltransferase A n=1 Tax=Thauera aminoaromatica S2 TaxID=1234381 RepID=N6Z7C5_THASP|nr:16S rRNA (adenine(1518)-N(6)/adenine(1519)-N(6))-dimethyltransferase RsmA [Thauera aminoaromatica]ENO88084.1 16S ribosomal RNA methyltransferase KsgA/Dim1 family protein [Thauera aminoaromatica S2]
MHDFDTDGHRARKRFGQNFLSDPNIIRKIIDGIRPQPGELMVEIGPGLGAMTDPLIERIGHLHVVEIDRDLIARLHERYTLAQLTVHEGDALKFDFGSLCAGEEGGVGPRLRIVGNLPYNISTPILFHLAGFADQVKDMTFMLQKEVVMRMVAEPGTEEYGRLSVMLQYRFRMGRLFDVPPGAFRPAPKVMSSIVRMAPLPAEQLGARDEALLGRIVAAAFGQRRKTLRNTLREFIDDAGLQALGIDPGLRGEKLSVEQYVAIANACAGRQG